jgi:hypothetical protein
MVHLQEVGGAAGESGKSVVRAAAAAEARSRFRLMGHILPITGLEEWLMVEAAMVAAGSYARACVEAACGPGAGPVLTGGRAVEEQQEWELAIQRLQNALRV